MQVTQVATPAKAQLMTPSIIRVRTKVCVLCQAQAAGSRRWLARQACTPTLVAKAQVMVAQATAIHMARKNIALHSIAK